MARIIDKGSAPPDDPLFSGRAEFFSVGARRPSRQGTAAGGDGGVSERSASPPEKPNPARVATEVSDFPPGTEFFAWDDRPVYRAPGDSPRVVGSDMPLFSMFELEVIDRAEFDALLANWSNRRVK